MIKDLYIKSGSGGGTAPVLPSGTYTPGNVGTIVWTGATGNMDTNAGIVKKVSGPGAWDGSVYATIEHSGDFELNFRFDYSLGGSNVMFGLDYYKASNSYEHIDFAFYRSSNNAQIFEAGMNVYTDPELVNDSTVYSIVRSGNQIIYKIDGSTVRTVNIINTFPMNIDCSFNDLGTVTDIGVIIP